MIASDIIRHGMWFTSEGQDTVMLWTSECSDAMNNPSGGPSGTRTTIKIISWV